MHRTGWDLQLTEYGDGHWRDDLSHRPGAFDRRRLGVGADGVAGDAASSMGQSRQSDADGNDEPRRLPFRCHFAGHLGPFLSFCGPSSCDAEMREIA